MTTPDVDRVRTVDIAGTDWPRYKLDALGLALAFFALALVLSHTMQVAVLTAAAVAVLVWWVGKLYSPRS
ncbi:MAG: hypothetical protein WAW17_18905 [Rhodococcus sp. (in: high G+C Gram-positive bacteria)]|uniref:hypothetical protein n=1 Tax=Rhodococcus sp. TaxID=1831 RepID=UPI003BAEEB29